MGSVNKSLRWCQSEQVELYVFRQEGENGKDGRFLIPGEFLRRRSRKFREMQGRMKLQGRIKSKTQKQTQSQFHLQLTLPYTHVQTIEDFFIWTFTPQPQIDQNASFDQVVRLGIFAWKYQIPALNNQVTDIIRTNLASGEFQLQAHTVDSIYEAAPAGSPLREVVRAALGRYRSSVEDKGAIRDDWKQIMVKHSQLGVDYLEATLSEWKHQSYLSGVCRFHDHQGVNKVNGFLADGCPYALEDCYPTWEEEEEEVLPVNGFAAEEEVEEEEVEPTPTRMNGGGRTPEPAATEWELETPIEEPEAYKADIPETLPVEEPVAEPFDKYGVVAEPAAEPLNDDILAEAFHPSHFDHDGAESFPEEPLAVSIDEAAAVPGEVLVDEATAVSEEVVLDGAAPVEEFTVNESPSVDHPPGPDESAPPTVVSDSVVDDTDSVHPTVETVSLLSEGKVAEPTTPQTTVEVKSLGGGKKNKKKKRNSVSQRN